MTTIGRPTLQQAVRSIYRQDLSGRIHVLIGVDKWIEGGDPSMLAQLASECPPGVGLTILDPGYSTSVRHGGLHSSHHGGALRVILTFLANSRLVAYLDDDNWFDPDHLSSLVSAINGKAWSFSRRRFVDAKTEHALADDTWQSLGPGKGVWATTQGGFVDTNCYLVDKLQCHSAIPAWSTSRWRNGSGDDRSFFPMIKSFPCGDTGRVTCNYRVSLDGLGVPFLGILAAAGTDIKELHDRQIIDQAQYDAYLVHTTRR